ncbi:g2517 [Coccomyxa elongata]
MDDLLLTTSADLHSSSPGDHRPAYRRTYSWAQNSDEASRGAVITISRTSAAPRYSEEDLERGISNDIHQIPEEQPLLVPNGEQRDESQEHRHLQSRIRFAMISSLIANVLLLVAKVVAFILSQSKSVLASAADSFVDIASQVVIALAEKYMRSADPRFPVGRTRLETVGVVACAIIMTIATIEVIQSAAEDLIAGFVRGELPVLDMGPLMYAILGAATVVKVVLFIYCFALKGQSDSMLALAEDHSNDIVSNLGAIACGAIASISPTVWWVDSVGAILISLYIIWSWARILQGQVNKIVGIGAPVEFVSTLEGLANAHHENMAVDVIRAYHFGARFIVEVEVIMPANMSVRESHDIALQLQHRVEGFDEVERAFVHVDYERRDEPEHKVDRNLQRQTSNLFEPHESCSLHGSGSGGVLPLMTSPRNSGNEDNKAGS